MYLTTVKNLFKDRTTKFLMVLIVVFHLAGFFFKAKEGNFYLDDSIEYLYMAGNIANEGVFYCGDLSKPINPDFYTKRPPLYPLYVTAVHLIFKSDLAVIFLQNLISLFNILLMIILAEKLRQTSVRIALIFLLISPVQVFYANMIMSEIILQTWILLMVNSYLRFFKAKNPINLFWGSLFLILAMLTKPVMYPFAAILLVGGLYFLLKDRIKLAMVYGLLPITFLLGYNLWNQNRTGVFHFSSIQTINLVQYNIYYFLINQFGDKDADEFLKSTYHKADQIENYTQRQSFLKKAALEKIKVNLPAYFWFHAKGVVRWFVDPGRFDYYNFFGVEAQKSSGFLKQLSREGTEKTFRNFLSQPFYMVVLLVSTFAVRVLLLSFMVLWLLLSQNSLLEKISVALPILFVAAATGPLGASRFMLPLLPLIILAASSSLNYMFASKAKINYC